MGKSKQLRMQRKNETNEQFYGEKKKTRDSMIKNHNLYLENTGDVCIQFKSIIENSFHTHKLVHCTYSF